MSCSSWQWNDPCLRVEPLSDDATVPRCSSLPSTPVRPSSSSISRIAVGRLSSLIPPHMMKSSSVELADSKDGSSRLESPTHPASMWPPTDTSQQFGNVSLCSLQRQHEQQRPVQ